MTTPITPTAPDTASSADAPVTLASQLYSTAPVVSSTDAAPIAPTVDAAPTDAKSADVVADDAPEYIQGDDQQWRRADGTFATAEEIAQIEAQLAETEKAEAEKEANRAATVVAIRGRNGESVEIEAPDEQTAQLLRQNVNDGMRRREFMEAQTAVEARAAIIARAETLIEHNPEGFVQENLTDEQQVRLATLLLSRHFDALIPIIQQYDTDPSARIAATAQAQLRIKQQTDDFHAHSTAQESAASVRKAVAALIPESVEQHIAEQFWADASADVQRALASGAQVTPETVPQLLATRMSLYGFAEAAPATPQRPRITLAKPNTAKPAAPAAALPVNANASQRLRLQQQRRNAAAIPPHGRGGPAKPAGAVTDRSFQDAAHLLYGSTTRAS